jgi:A1 cistron-splicing factor AAR2
MEHYSQTTTLIILSLPQNTSLALDALAFTSTSNFRGIKYIPSGLHLFTYGQDKSELGMRSAFFFIARAGEVLPWQWDPSTEELRKVQEQLTPNELAASKSPPPPRGPC